MYNKESLRKEIAGIRELLSQNNLHDAFNNMIDLNIFDASIDEYTKYFSNTLSDDANIEYDFELDEINGTIVVESVLGGYIPAKVSDFEDTLKEIEEKFL